MTVHHGKKTRFQNVHCVASAIALVVLLAVLANFAAAEAFAQPAAGGPPEVRGRMTPDQIKAMEAARAAGQQPPGQPGQPNQPKPDEGKKPKEGEGEKKEGGSDAVKRPDTPPRAPDPRELKVALDEKGNVPPFNFIGQPWPDVMQWLANLSKSSLDWQELPKGYLNLTTQRAYKLDDVHDLINQALNARGYTSIRSGEVLSVYKIEKLDPSVVRQVSEEDLYNLNRYDYVKVSFEVPSELEIEKAKEDVKQILSPQAKVFPLVTTRKLLIMDSVANLRTVSELFNQERMIESGQIVPRNFPLKHARPEQVIETLYVILGVDPKGKPAQTVTPQQQQQQMQMMEQMRQQGRDVSKMMPKDAPKVFLAYNRQLNSVMANAPAKEMKIIEQTIALLDVPFGGNSLNIGATGGLTDDGRQMKRHQLTTLDPENFMQTLEEIGGLSPYAQFKVDKKSKTLFALASEEDHKTINELIGQFDGTGRQFEVVWLRRLPADAVAGTINKLMAGQGQEEKDDSRDRYRWWDYGRNDDDEDDQPLQGFGCDADVENNRLLLWANEDEMQRVRDLLIKLGEIPPGQTTQRPVRFLELNGEQPSAELLNRIREAWSSAGGNELIINAPPANAAEKPKEESKTPETKKDESEANEEKPESDRATSIQKTRVAARFAQLGGTDAEAKGSAEIKSDEQSPETKTAPAGSEPADPESKASNSPATGKTTPEPNSQAPPVTVTVTEDGRIMLSSQDTAALDRMEELINELSPPEKRYKVFRLQHIPALHMYWDLTDFFEEELEEESSGYTRDWYGFMVPKGKKDTSVGLAKRRKLMITYDVPSNSILVANASASQLLEIESLINEFDRPAPADSAEIRQTASIKIYYSRPSVIAAAVKEVYRDLLSLRDKEFDRGEGGKGGEQRASAERVTILNYGSSGSNSSNVQSKVKVGFDARFSLGADDVSGVLIVSAQKGIFDDIVQMVRELDQEAAPQTTVRVHRLNGNVSAEALQKAIGNAVGTAWLGNRPDQTGSANQKGQPQGDERRDRDRDRDRDSDRRRSRDNN